MKTSLFLILLLATPLSTYAKEASLPKNYKSAYTEYLSLDRVQNPDQFIKLYANDIAMNGKNESGELPEGSILVAEVYSVHKDAKGKVKTSRLNRRIPKEPILLAVMEKNSRYINDASSLIQTGSWGFGAYKPNGENANKDLNTCRGCHMPLKENDFLFSIEHIGIK